MPKLREIIEVKIAEILVFAVMDALTKMDYKLELCGSLRRQDILNIYSLSFVCNSRIVFNRKNIKRALRRKGFSIRKLPIIRGMAAGSGFLMNKTPVYLYAANDLAWGAATLLHTGNLFFTRLIQKHAALMGYKLNGQGLWFGDDRIAGKDEKQIFYALGIAYVPPEYRNFKKGDYLPVI